MRVLAFAFSALVLLPSSLFAGDVGSHRLPTVTVKPENEIYRGYYTSLAAVADRKDLADLTEGLRHQIDIVEGAGLSHRVLEFFHTLPIRVDEFACVGYMTAAPPSGEMKPIMEAACYGRNVPESMRDKQLGASVWDDQKGWSNSFDPATQAAAQWTGTVMVRPSTLVDHR